ncbi:hypothetical protein KI387_006916, partial [Taxus chinensis]
KARPGQSPGRRWICSLPVDMQDGSLDGLGDESATADACSATACDIGEILVEGRASSG